MLFLASHLPIFYPYFSWTSVHTVYFVLLCLVYLCFWLSSPLYSSTLDSYSDQCLYDSLLLNFPFSIPLTLSSSPFFFLFSPRVTLDPSKRQSSNKSMSGCTLPQGTKTVSKSSFPMFSGCFCLPDCLPVYQPPTPSSSHSLSVVGWSLFTQTCLTILYNVKHTVCRQIFSTGLDQ